MKSDLPVKRGDVKRFREYLNVTYAGTANHRNGVYQQKTRPYGDYLYAQDRDKFQFEMREWLLSQKRKPSTARPSTEGKV